VKKILLVIFLLTVFNAYAEGAKVIDISSQGYEYPKIITSMSYLSRFYRCISWIPDTANPEPKPEKCWLLKSDN
jgi:hypothetical protein